MLSRILWPGARRGRIAPPPAYHIISQVSTIKYVFYSSPISHYSLSSGYTTQQYPDPLGSVTWFPANNITITSYKPPITTVTPCTHTPLPVAICGTLPLLVSLSPYPHISLSPCLPLYLLRKKKKTKEISIWGEIRRYTYKVRDKYVHNYRGMGVWLVQSTSIIGGL